MTVVSNELKQRVMARLLEVTAIVNARYNSNIRVPNIYYSLRGKVAGRASQSGWIKLNPVFLLENTELFIHRTVAHEMMHICCYHLFPRSSGHGPEWKSLMRLVGAPETRCHDYDVSTIVKRRGGSFQYSCGCKGRVHTLSALLHRRIQTEGSRQCRFCRQYVKHIDYSQVTTVQSVEQSKPANVKSVRLAVAMPNERVGAFTQRLLRTTIMSDAEIIKAIQTSFKDSKYGKKEIAWNRWKLKKESNT